jgi:hypothetical protein
MSNDCKHVCKLVVAWMCEYCPNVVMCQLRLNRGELNHAQMCICLDNGVMFNTNNFPKEFKNGFQEDKK